MTREEFRQMAKDARATIDAMRERLAAQKTALDKIEEQLERIAWDETLLVVNDNYTAQAVGKIEEQLERIAWDETLLVVNDNYTAQAVGRLLREIAEHPDDYAALFDDNGAEPDGTAYVIPAEHLTRRDALIVVHCGLMEAVVGDILDGYDGSEEVRAWMDEHYPRGWSGYSSRDEAYGIAYTFCLAAVQRPRRV